TTAEYIAGLRLLDNNDRRDWIGLGRATEGTSSLAIPFGQKSALYRAAVSLLGKHLTLNKNVDPELGCAEAVSYVIHQAYPAANIPKSGYPGTAGLYDWLRGSRLFKELRACVLKAPDGTIIISTTPKGGGTHGHV